MQTCSTGVENPPGYKDLFRNCGLPADTPVSNAHHGTLWYCAKHAAEARAFFNRVGASELKRLDQTKGAS